MRKRLPTWGFVQAGLDVKTSAVCIAELWFGLDNQQCQPAQSPVRLNDSTITTVCKVIGGLPDDGLTGEQSFADIYKNYHEWTII